MFRVFALPARLGRVFRQRWARALLAVLVALWFTRLIAVFVTDAQWYYAIGRGDIWRGRVVTQSTLFLITAVCAFAFAALPLRAITLLPEPTLKLPARYESLAAWITSFNHRATRIAWIVIAVVSLLLARAVATHWREWLLFRHGGTYGVRDPYLQRDVGFYVFRLSGWHLMLDIAWILVTVTLVLTTILTLGRAAATLLSRTPHLPRFAVRRIAVLSALLLALRAGDYYLAQFDLVTAQHPGATLAAGMSFVDWYVHRPFLWLGIALCLALAVVLGLYAWREGASSSPRMLSWRSLLLLLSGAVMGLFAPPVLSRVVAWLVALFIVAPDEERRELPYLSGHLQATRAAWRLDKIAVEQRRATAPLRASVSALDLDAVRVWDEAGLAKAARTREAGEAGRPYYQLSAMQLDRYVIGGRERLVGVAAREIQPSAVPDDWVNRHASERYSYGVGAVVCSAGETTPNGEPSALLRGLPPLTSGRDPSAVLNLREPRVFYGQTEQPYVLMEEGIAGGVAVSSFWWRLAWAWRLGDINLLLHPLKNATTAGTSASDGAVGQPRLLFRRSMRERAAALAPFLVPDGAAYPVIHEGRLVWMLDLLTATAFYPAAKSFSDSAPNSALTDFNAARDSVKMVMDAAQGRVTFFVSDEQAASDPILSAWRKALPSLVQPLEEMPSALREHRRYPRTLFVTQLDIFGRYHTTSPTSFYKRDEVWTSLQRNAMEQGTAQQSAQAGERQEDASRELLSGYALLPGVARSGRSAQGANRFVMQAALRSHDKPGLVAQLIADCDGGNYGQLTLLRFDTSNSRDGAMWGNPRTLVERLERKRPVTQDITFGDILLVPSGLPNGRVLLFMPLYFTRGDMTKLDRVVVADVSSRNLAAIGNDKHSAVVALLRLQPDDTETVALLAAQALKLHNQIQEATRQGQWAQYGKLMSQQREILRRLQNAAKE